jgi:hypothetical protein
VEPVPSVHRGTANVNLPARQFMAVRLRRVTTDA